MKTKIDILSVYCPRKECDATAGRQCREWVLGRGYIVTKKAHTERVALTKRGQND